MRRGRIFTNEEKAYLKANHKKMYVEDMAEELDRTSISITAMLSRLNLSRMCKGKYKSTTIYVTPDPGYNELQKLAYCRAWT